MRHSNVMQQHNYSSMSRFVRQYFESKRTYSMRQYLLPCCASRISLQKFNIIIYKSSTVIDFFKYFQFFYLTIHFSLPMLILIDLFGGDVKKLQSAKKYLPTTQIHSFSSTYCDPGNFQPQLISAK